MILSVKDLCFSYGTHRALDGVSFEMQRGEIVFEWLVKGASTVPEQTGGAR